MDCIGVVVGVISAIISSIVFIWLGLGICKRDIKIKHNINPYDWFAVHTIVYIVTITLSIIVDYIQTNFESVKEMQIGLMGCAILFIKKGGLIIIVMVISSLIYNCYIKVYEFKYFIKRYPWIKKIFFSIICISLWLLYFLGIKREDNNTNMLLDDYSFIVAWIINLIQIWIGFDMKFYEWEEIKDYYSKWKARIKNKEEKKYFILCILSMFVIPIMLTVYFVVKEKIPDGVFKRVFKIMPFLFYGITFGAIVLFIVVFFWNLKHIPNNRISKRRLNNCLNNLFNNNKKIQVNYYEGVEYCVVKKSSSVILVASIGNITFDEDVQFDEYRERLKKLSELFECKYSFEEFNEEEIRTDIGSILSKLAKDRKDILKEGWKKVYEECKKKEKEK